METMNNASSLLEIPSEYESSKTIEVIKKAREAKETKDSLSILQMWAQMACSALGTSEHLEIAKLHFECGRLLLNFLKKGGEPSEVLSWYKERQKQPEESTKQLAYRIPEESFEFTKAFFSKIVSNEKGSLESRLSGFQALLKTHRKAAQLKILTDRPTEAIPEYEKALHIMVGVTEIDPDNSFKVAKTRYFLAEALHSASNREAEAKKQVELGLGILDQIMKTSQDDKSAKELKEKMNILKEKVGIASKKEEEQKDSNQSSTSLYTALEEMPLSCSISNFRTVSDADISAHLRDNERRLAFKRNENSSDLNFNGKFLSGKKNTKEEETLSSGGFPKPILKGTPVKTIQVNILHKGPVSTGSQVDRRLCARTGYPIYGSANQKREVKSLEFSGMEIDDPVLSNGHKEKQVRFEKEEKNKK